MRIWTTLPAATLLAAAVFAGEPGKPHQRFIENKGQFPAQVRYRAEFGTASLFAEQGGFTWSMLQSDVGERVHEVMHAQEEGREASFEMHGHAWRMHFVDADPDPRITSSDRSTAYLNYFLGNDPSHWAGHVGLFGEVLYGGLWNGIDLRLRSAEGGFKYDVLVAAGADVAQVRFAYEGLDGMMIDPQGRLIMRTSVGELTELAPVAWYADGAKEPVDCRFTLTDGQVGFAFGSNTRTDRPIVIDPLLIASTLSGTGDIGTTQNYGHSATYDIAGNIYTGAICFGQGYPVTTGAFSTIYNGGGTDMSLSKLNPDGSDLIYATYLGGNQGDSPHSLLVSAQDELVVFGTSQSGNFPTSTGAYDATMNGGGDFTVTKFTQDGSDIIGSTFIGGNNTEYIYSLGGIGGGDALTDAAGNVYCVSSAQSGFPTTPGAYQTAFGGGGYDGVVFCFNNDLSVLNWSTYLGSSGDDCSSGLKQDAAGDLYVTGSTTSASFPTTAGAWQTSLSGLTDAYVVKLTGNGSTLAIGTLFGTPMDDYGAFIQLDINGDVFIHGHTTGTIPIQPPGTYGVANSPMFVLKFTPDLTTLPMSTVVGIAGAGWYSFLTLAFLVDNCGHLYLCGYSAAPGLPLTPNSLQSSGGFYLSGYDVDMSNLLFASYYGGPGDHVDGGTSRFDANGIIYQGVCTGGGFPTTPWAWSNTQPSGYDIGVFKIDFQISGVNAAGAGVVSEGCAPIDIAFINGSTGNQWTWDFGDGSPLDTTYTPTHTYTTPGAYTVTLIAYDSLSCNLADTTTFPVTIGQAQTLTAAFTAVNESDCAISQVTTTNGSTGAPLAFIWDMGDGTQYSDTNVTHIYDLGPGTYDVELLVYDPTGCSPPDSLTQSITVLPPDTVSADFTVTQVPDCEDLLVDAINSSIGPGPSYFWDMDDGTTYNTTNVTGHLYSGAGTYTITLIATDPLACNQADTVTVDITIEPAEPISAAFTATQVFDCEDLLLETTNNSTGTYMAFAWDMGDGTQYTDTNVTHTFSGAGSYDVVLVTSSVLGCVPNDTATLTVTIDPIIPITAGFTIEQTGNCDLLSVEAINQSTGDSVAYAWNMGDGTTYSTVDVTHVYAAPGTYVVELVVEDLGCGNDAAFTAPITVINELPLVAATNGVVCPRLTTTIHATGAAGTYLWSDGTTADSLVVAEAGTYWVTVSDGFCTGTDTVDVIAAPDLELSHGFDACPGPVVLSVPFNGTAYLWETGGTQQSEQVTFPGVAVVDYDFEVWDAHGCVHRDSVTVTPLDSVPQLFAPNAFTPDDDGVNDEFVISGFGEQDVDLMIFDRWGEMVFRTQTLTDTWDGAFKGQVKQDVYVYKLEYNGVCQNEKTSVFGHVSVLR